MQEIELLVSEMRHFQIRLNSTQFAFVATFVHFVIERQWNYIQKFCSIYDELNLFSF